MNENVLTKPQADFKLMLMNAEAESLTSSEVYLWLTESGMPSELAIRLEQLVNLTAEVAEKTIKIGKIILVKIIEFVKKHPNLSTGIAVGAAIGALVATIPVLGVYLAPIVAIISASVGAIAGHRMDKIEQGKTVNVSDDISVIIEDVIEIAKEFFKLLIDIFNTIFDENVIIQTA